LTGLFGQGALAFAMSGVAEITAMDSSDLRRRRRELCIKYLALIDL
jgi:hypothetical protein